MNLRSSFRLFVNIIYINKGAYSFLDIFIGKGEYPWHDPWGVEFSESHDPLRYKLAGKKLKFLGILEGIQSDQDYLRLLFNLQHVPSRQICCHYCKTIQWVSNRHPISATNTPESLYTVFGPREGDCEQLSRKVFVKSTIFSCSTPTVIYSDIT